MGNTNQRATDSSSPARKRVKTLNGSISFRSIASLASNRFSNNSSDDHNHLKFGRKRKHIEVSDSPSTGSGSIISIERHWPAYTNSVFEPEFPITGRICESDFVILNALGKGRFANVYRAIYRSSALHSNNSHVAIKIQDKMKILKAGAEEQIKNERLLGKNGFVAEFLDSWQTSQELFTIMEYIDGSGDLFSLFSEYGQFSEQITCLYSVEIALGLQFLHTRGIIHRDLKLENLSLDSSLHIKFVDFGFSKHLEPNSRTKTICGTLQFMAPEIATEQPYSFEADWWSYGITLFIMRTGQYPFPNNCAITHNDLTFKKQEFPETCSDEFKELIDKLLVIDPVRRLSSTSELFNQRFFEDVNIEGIQSKEVSPFEILKSECNSIERLKIHHGFDEHYNNFDFSIE